MGVVDGDLTFIPPVPPDPDQAGLHAAFFDAAKAKLKGMMGLPEPGVSVQELFPKIGAPPIVPLSPVPDAYMPVHFESKVIGGYEATAKAVAKLKEISAAFDKPVTVSIQALSESYGLYKPGDYLTLHPGPGAPEMTLQIKKVTYNHDPFTMEPHLEADLQAVGPVPEEAINALCNGPEELEVTSSAEPFPPPSGPAIYDCEKHQWTCPDGKIVTKEAAEAMAKDAGVDPYSENLGWQLPHMLANYLK